MIHYTSYKLKTFFYRESIDGACRKAVDNFFLSYKDQLTAAVSIKQKCF